MFRFITPVVTALAICVGIATAAEVAPINVGQQALDQLSAGQVPSAIATLKTLTEQEAGRDAVREANYIVGLLNAGQVSEAREATATLVKDLDDHGHHDYERGREDGFREGRSDRHHHRPFNPNPHHGSDHYRRGFHEGYREGYHGHGVADVQGKASTIATTVATADHDDHGHHDYERGREDGFREGRSDRHHHRPFNPNPHHGSEHYRRGFHEGYREGYHGHGVADAAKASSVAAPTAVATADHDDHGHHDYEPGR